MSSKETYSFFIDFSLKSSAFFPNSQTVLVKAIMYYNLINKTLQQIYDL